MINRRVALKNILMVMTGAVIIPHHLRAANGPSIQLRNIAVSASQEALLAEVVDAFIPPTDTPGAKELKVHLFVLLMLDDCHSQEDQRRFVAGLDQLDAFARALTQKNFSDCPPPERVRVLSSLNQKSSPSPELRSFYRLLRSRTIQGYRESEYVMTHLSPHAMIPPPYDGYYPAKNYEQSEASA